MNAWHLAKGGGESTPAVLFDSKAYAFSTVAGAALPGDVLGAGRPPGRRSGPGTGAHDDVGPGRRPWALTRGHVADPSRWYELTVAYTAARTGNQLPLTVLSADLAPDGLTFVVDDCSLVTVQP